VVSFVGDVWRFKCCRVSARLLVVVVDVLPLDSEVEEVVESSIFFSSTSSLVSYSSDEMEEAMCGISLSS